VRPVAAYTVFNRTRGILLASEAELAGSLTSRIRGLIGRSAGEFNCGKGMWIVPSQGIHTIGMAFPIDAAYLDRRGRILRTIHRLAPYRIGSWSFRTRSVLELPAGILARTGTEVGDVLDFELNDRSDV